MMAFFGYLDGSGDSVDPQSKVVSVSGFIAHESQWAEFERRWNEILGRYGVSALHMKEFAHSIKGSDFETWKGDKTKRDSFMSELTDVINGCTVHSVGATVVRAAYDNCNDDYALRESFGGAYAICAVQSVAMAIKWHRDNKLTEPLILIIEKGDTDQSGFTDFIKKLGGWKGFDLVTEPIFQKKKWKDDVTGEVHYCVPFQSSDFLAYEHTKMFTDFIIDPITVRVR